MVEMTQDTDSVHVLEEYQGVEFPAAFEYVASVAARLLAFCLKHDVSRGTCSQLELAVVEALNNAIEHGCAGIPDARVRMRWAWEDDTLEVRIYDPGHFIPNPAEAALPEDKLAEGGRGAFVMATLMDRVEHRLKDGHHCVVMYKRLGPKPIHRSKDIQSAELLRAMTAELSISYETLAALFHFSQELATAPSYDIFVGHVLERLLEVLSAHEANVRLALPRGGLKLSCARFRAEPGMHLNPENGYITVLPPQEQTIEFLAFAAGTEQTVDDCSAVPRSDPLWRPFGKAFICPLFFQGRVLGVLTVLRLNDKPFFSAGHISLIRTIAEFLGIARTTMLLQQQRAEEQRAIREIELAAEIQQSLVPESFPRTRNALVHGLSQAAFKVGGDYLDAMTIGNDGVLLAIADVMGKGLRAALLATILRTSVRARLDFAEDPGDLLTEVNHQISPDLARLDSFITAQIAFYSAKSGEMLYASAGHCPVVKFAAGSASGEECRAGGVPLGIIRTERYETYRVAAQPGDRFVFLTDGIYEAESPAGELLGWARILAEIPNLLEGPPNDFCQRVLKYVRKFTGGAEPSDDRTLLTIECI
jgi:serine phosphatase RsbU (regulator of sigma subunit)/anti-sigma regulatory factor (Ser/Thr protein kinase)